VYTLNTQYGFILTYCISSMKVLTWNTLASEWIDDKTYKIVKKDIRCNAKTRFQVIMKRINDLNPTIILLQEVMPEQYNKLYLMLNKTYIITQLVVIKWEDRRNNSGNVSLFKRTDFSDKHIQHSPLDYGIQTTCIYKKRTCKIYNVHLSDISVYERNKQLNTIMPSLLDNNHCIIAGDFNHQYRLNTKLYNIPNYTIHNTNCPTYFIERKMNIDNILSKGFTTNSLTTCPEYPQGMEDGFIRYGSDHLPIVVDITLSSS
jgi:endonuclease/exonuclease/phosphatase family metal-dependent hydrolase